MADFDFPHAAPPELVPLHHSYDENEIEAELKRLAMDLFRKKLAKRAYDINVMGAAHLGSFELVQRSITQDGLALLPGGAEEAARYIYRAWKSNATQGRGLHFVRTYLQLLFPNVSKVEQLYMPIGGNYPEDCFSIIPEDEFIVPRIADDAGLRLDGSWEVGGVINTSDQGEEGAWTYDTSGLILTSRVLVTLDFSVDISGVGNLLQILRSVLPARLVPVFNFAIQAESPVPVESEFAVEVDMDDTEVLSHPDLLFLTDEEHQEWGLGSNEDPAGARQLHSGRVDVFENDEPLSPPD